MVRAVGFVIPTEISGSITNLKQPAALAPHVIEKPRVSLQAVGQVMVDLVEQRRGTVQTFEGF